MNKKPSVTVIAALLLVNACGSRVGAREEPVVESVPVVADLSDVLSIDESIADPLPIPPNTASKVGASDHEPGPSDTGPDQTESTPDRTSVPSQSAPSSTTPTTTVAPTGQQTITTQPPVEIDLDALTEAVRELDVLLGLFDGQVDSVDLDETEGETP